MIWRRDEVVVECSPKEIAESIAGLRYDAMEEVLRQLSKQLYVDALSDEGRKRMALAIQLNGVALILESAAARVNQAWKICEKHEPKD